MILYKKILRNTTLPPRQIVFRVPEPLEVFCINVKDNYFALLLQISKLTDL